MRKGIACRRNFAFLIRAAPLWRRAAGRRNQIGRESEPPKKEILYVWFYESAFQKERVRSMEREALARALRRRDQRVYEELMED